MNILAIDPGTSQSAFVEWQEGKIKDSGIVPNPQLLAMLRDPGEIYTQELCIEAVASYGMPVGKEVFETCFWIGRFMQQWIVYHAKEPRLVYRRDVKLHHCASAKAKDSNIRQALIDKYGQPWTWKVIDPNKPATGKNRVKVEGVTFGLHDDLWAAFSLATYASETSGGAA